MLTCHSFRRSNNTILDRGDWDSTRGGSRVWRPRVADLSGAAGRGFCASFEGKCAGKRISPLGKASGRLGHDDQFRGRDLVDGCAGVWLSSSEPPQNLAIDARLGGPKAPLFLVRSCTRVRPATPVHAFFLWSLRDNWTA